MRVGTIYWNDTLDKTEVKWSDDFVMRSWIEKMDVLTDVEVITEKAKDFVHRYHREDSEHYIPKTRWGN